MSDEQKLQPKDDDEAVAMAEAEVVSWKFAALHPLFIQNPKNVEILMKWIYGLDSHGRPRTDRQWNLPNLEAAYAAVESQLELRTPQTSTPAPVTAVPVPPQPAEVKETSAPKPWGRLTPAIVLAMPRETYKEFFKDSRFRDEVTKVMKGAK